MNRDFKTLLSGEMPDIYLTVSVITVSCYITFVLQLLIFKTKGILNLTV